MSIILPSFSCLKPLPKVEHKALFPISKWPNSISWCRYLNNYASRSTIQMIPRSKSNVANEEEDEDDPFTDMDVRLEWRRKIKEAIDSCPDVEEELDPVEKQKRIQKLAADYQLVVDEEDPDWPEDAEGRGFNMDQFFNKITIKNNREDDDNYDSDKEMVWQDDNYIRPIKDIPSSEWEVTVFKDISPLMVFVHHRYRRPKENDMMRSELEKAVNIIWNCRLPSPRIVAIDAVVEDELVSALKVSTFPELIFIKSGKIVLRQKEMRNADELSKMMAFFYFGAAKPPCLNQMIKNEEVIPTISINNKNINLDMKL